ncbi:MAG: helix-turn-helix domain-containing protein [Candidatus Methanomethylophilaceae archaeon]|jgi:excisionase family DNA binding protein
MVDTIKKYLSVREVADSKGVTTAYIRKLIRDGKLPAIKVGLQHIIAEEDAAALKIGKDKEG